MHRDVSSVCLAHRGGINQTVTGEYLDSVADPLMLCRGFFKLQYIGLWLGVG